MIILHVDLSEILETWVLAVVFAARVKWLWIESWSGTICLFFFWGWPETGLWGIFSLKQPALAGCKVKVPCFLTIVPIIENNIDVIDASFDWVI